MFQQSLHSVIGTFLTRRTTIQICFHAWAPTGLISLRNRQNDTGIGYLCAVNSKPVPYIHEKNLPCPTLHLALPVLNESRRMETLIESLQNQNYPNFNLYVCVNQPDDWWQSPEKRIICHDNAITLERFKKITHFPVTIIDRSSPGNGWKGKHHGVGWARKMAMDAIERVAQPSDLIVSIDADTFYPVGYLGSLAENFHLNHDATAFAIPYYHPLTGDERTDRAILRYEIYMRYYAINLWRCQIPYRFTAIGSAMATPVWAYRRISGITPHQSGEDFYFIQKLSKTGRVVTWNREPAFPAARFSNRVFFGTGPAMIKGDAGDWSAYPFYDPAHFNLVGNTFRQLHEAHAKNIDNQFITFLNQVFQTNDLFEPLRTNHGSTPRFVKAATERIDALRILQYLRHTQKNSKNGDEAQLSSFVETYFQTIISSNFSFTCSPVNEIDNVRNLLYKIETDYQYQEWQHTNTNSS